MFSVEKTKGLAQTSNLAVANTSVCSANMRSIAAGDQRATNWTNAKG